MKIDVLTLFPEMFRGPFDESIIRRAQEKNLVEIAVRDLRDWASDKHKTVDDRPYGGGPGMVMMIEPVSKALQDLKSKKSRVILLTPQGKVFKQAIAKGLSKSKHLILLCGRYEGVDERIRLHLVDQEISVGDYVLTGGELPAMVVVDAVVRLIPGVLKRQDAVTSESFSEWKMENGKWKVSLEHPQYTRPEKFKNWKVPDVLISGNHAKIEKWRKKQAEKRTQERRPDLIEK